MTGVLGSNKTAPSFLGAVFFPASGERIVMSFVVAPFKRLQDETRAKLLGFEMAPIFIQIWLARKTMDSGSREY